MIKIFNIFVFLVIFANVSFANQLNLTNNEQQYLKNHPIIKAHNETNWAPFNYNENGIAKGFSIDYMNLLVSKIGVKVKYISGYSWNEYMDMLQTNKLDTIINISKNKQREKSIAFTDIFYSTQNVIYSQKDSKEYTNLKDLNGKTIAITKGFYVQKLLEEYYPNIKQVLVKNQLEALKLLSLKKVDATLGKKVVMDYLALNNIIAGVAATGFVEDDRFVSHIRIGASKKDTILIDILKKAQKTISQKEMQLLKQKWFGSLDINILTIFEKQYLKDKKVIKVCTNPNWKPIEFIANNKPQGISIDTLNIVADKLKVKLEYIKTSSWSQSQEFLEQKRCDLLPAAIKTTKREKYANFTKPYLSYDLAIITTNDKPLVSSLEDIIHETMARKKGSGLIAKLKSKYPNIKIRETKGYKESFKLVSSKDIYFTVATLPVLNYYKKIYKLDNLQIAGYTKMKYNLSMAVRKDDLVLKNCINKVLNNIPKNTKKIIYDKWVNKNIVENVDYTLVWQIGGVLVLIILIILFFTIKQQKLNNQIQLLNKKLKSEVEEAIKDTKRKENLLQQQSRLAQMGEMISMIAHQWRQPLAAISSTSGSITLKAKLNKLDKDTAIELSKKISEYSQHLSLTIDDFREFFKTNKEKKKTTYDEMIQSVLGIIEISIKNRKINIIKQLKSKNIFDTHPNEIKQVILNLIKNAEDVLLEKEIKNPTITITTKDNILSISDNGGGVPKDIIDKIFDPYFSTKTKKDGTGLGLYMSKTIIEEHCGGSLSVSNDVIIDQDGKPSSGAVFTIELRNK